MRQLLSNAALISVALIVSLFSLLVQSEEAKELEKITVGIEDKKMKALWDKASREGTLPPISEIPIPEKRISKRTSITIEGLDVSRQSRPRIDKRSIAEVQPYTVKELSQYEGVFKIIQNENGILIGTVEGYDTPLELYYRLPVQSTKMKSFKKSHDLTLNYKNEVIDSALQRRIVLSNKGKIAPFVHIAEGRHKRYVEYIKEIGLKIEQQKVLGNPPVKVTYMNKSVVLNPGERRKIGEVEVFLQSSVAIDQSEKVLREGQPYYVSLVVYALD